jgi:hypothetical protein
MIVAGQAGGMKNKTSTSDELRREVSILVVRTRTIDGLEATSGRFPAIGGMARRLLSDH